MSIINIFSDLTKSSGSGFGSLSWRNIQEGIRFFESLPTPEESLVEAKRQETELESTISKIKDKIEEIEAKMLNDCENPEEINDLEDSADYLKNQLENYEAEYEYVKEQSVMFNAITNEDDDNFIDNIPTFYDAMKNSVDRQIKDVKETVSIIKKTKRQIEICIDCKKKIRDEKGRKSSVKHYHINLLSFREFCKSSGSEASKDVNIRDYENDEYIYTPVICESCMGKISLSSDISNDTSVVKNCSKGEVDYGYLVNFDKKTLIELSNKYLTFVEELVKIDEIKYKENVVGTSSSETETEGAMSEKDTLKYFIDFFKSISDVCDCEECIENKNKREEKYNKLEEMLEEKEHKIEVIEE
jgi:hypothetical protein